MYVYCYPQKDRKVSCHYFRRGSLFSFLMIAVIVLLFDGKFSDVYYSSYKYTRIYIYTMLNYSHSLG